MQYAEAQLKPRCPRCDGLLVSVRDIQGAYMGCLSCGHHRYPGGVVVVGPRRRGSSEPGL
jgi:hypothetical protein